MGHRTAGVVVSSMEVDTMISRRVLLALAAIMVICASSKVATSSEPWPDVSAIIAPIDGALAQVNANDGARLSSYFTSGAVIIDDFGPFTWQGSDAAARWLGDIDDYNSLARFKNWHLSAKDPQTLEINAGQTAYVLVPVDVTFDVDGKFLRRARLCALTLTHTAGVWKIKSATWITQVGRPKVGRISSSASRH